MKVSFKSKKFEKSQTKDRTDSWVLLHVEHLKQFVHRQFCSNCWCIIWFSRRHMKCPRTLQSAQLTNREFLSWPQTLHSPRLSSMSGSAAAPQTVCRRRSPIGCGLCVDGNVVSFAGSTVNNFFFAGIPLAMSWKASVLVAGCGCLRRPIVRQRLAVVCSYR